MSAFLLKRLGKLLKILIIENKGVIENMARGISAEQIESELLDSNTGKLVPCYIGSAPIWQVDDTEWNNIAGQAFLITGLKDARKKIGYMLPQSGMFPKDISLCEAINVHFAQNEVVGPIIVLVNAASIDVDENTTTAEVSVKGGTAIINVSGKAVLSSVTVSGKEKGTNYTVSYDDTGTFLVFKELNKSLGEKINVTYNTVATEELVMAADTFDMIDFLEQTIGYVPCVLAAPLWETELIGGTGTETVASKLVDISNGKINSHWYTQCYTQLYSNSRDSVKSEKSTKLFTSPKQKVFWPFASKNGLIYTLVTLFIARKLAIDIENDNIPFESASNEEIDIDFLCNSSGTKIWQKEENATALNEIGVTTCNYTGGSWRTWGVCMANYDENNESILPEYMNDVAVQMRDYVCNDFQAKNIDYIDKPLPDRVVKEIVDDYQQELNTLVGVGALLFASISYGADNNSATSEKGDFIFDLKETSTPPGKSIKAKVQYVRDGLTSYSSSSEEGSDE